MGSPAAAADRALRAAAAGGVLSSPARTTPGDAPLVSVVTPVYNGGSYLAECIESVQAQTYPNWRHVIVDNVSTDATGQIARRYSDADPRIRVESPSEFLPVIPNWNRAIDAADPDAAYVKVVHADDRLFPECLERMVAVGERNPSADVIGSFRLDDTQVNLDGIPLDQELVDGRELCRRLLLGERGYLFGSPTSTMLRSDAVRRRHPFYSEEYLHADTEACFHLLQRGDFGFVHQVLTYTRRHRAAVTAHAIRMGTYIPERAQMLERYGPAFLTPAERERKMAYIAGTYARFLATRPHRLRDPEFRDFHRATARKLRGRIGTGALLRGLAGGAANRVRRRLGGKEDAG